jgi:F0F1-type ATP synthase assembly protein I
MGETEYRPNESERRADQPLEIMCLRLLTGAVLVVIGVASVVGLLFTTAPLLQVVFLVLTALASVLLCMRLWDRVH